MKHILFITPYYPPENAAPAVRISETAARLVQRGYQVTVLTTVPNYPTGIVPAAYRGRLMQQEMREGVKVVRVWSYTSPNTGFLRRVIAQFSFGCLAAVLGARAVGLPDVIIVESPPLFDAIAARVMAWLKRCPFIFLVSDLWPESAVQLGIVRNRILIRLAEWLEWSTYQKASLIWVVTEGIRQNLLKRGLAAERIFLLTNGVDTNKFQPMDKGQARGELGWGEHFTVLYAGTHGLAHGLETVLEAAELLKDRLDIRFVFVGDGAAKASLVAQARQSELCNVTFLDARTHDDMPLVIAGADVCLVPLRKLPLFEGALPSKSYEVMACARPIILAVAGEARTLIEQEAGAALAIEPESASALVHSILYLYTHAAEGERLGQRGRAFVKARFERDQLTTALETQLQALFDKAMAVRRGHGGGKRRMRGMMKAASAMWGGGKNSMASQVEQEGAMLTQEIAYVWTPQANIYTRRRPPSPLLWRFAALAGDGVALTVSLVIMLALSSPSYPGFNASKSLFGLPPASMMWLLLVLACWSIAVSITQAQELHCTGSVLKSPLFALASLVLMLVFCIGLCSLFIGTAVLSYTISWLLLLGIAATLLSVWRVMLAEIMHLPQFRRRAVIVGANQAGMSIAQELRQARHPGIHVLGYICAGSEDTGEIDGVPVIGGKSVLAQLVQYKLIDVLIMAIDYHTYPEIFQQALQAAQYGISAVPVTTMYEHSSGKLAVEDIVDQWYTVMPSENASSPLYVCWNSLLDLAFGLCGLLLLALVFPIVALLIYLDSPGPIFYTQQRTGYHGRVFSMYKFRSMHSEVGDVPSPPETVAHAGDDEGVPSPPETVPLLLPLPAGNAGAQAQRPAWVTKGDARITNVGRFLRATHLDELPQALNILRGDMSLIGPRPERPVFIAELEKRNLFYSSRLSVKPGLTGWAQVKYGYGATEQDELIKLQYDLFYIKHRSFLLDLLIILKTVIEVGFGHGN